MKTAVRKTYRVKIAREQFNGRDSWVARDDNGDWRAYGDAHFAASAAEAAPKIFHADEVANVVDHGDHAVAFIYE